jgi:hypothetical protein
MMMMMMMQCLDVLPRPCATNGTHRITAVPDRQSTACVDVTAQHRKQLRASQQRIQYGGPTQQLQRCWHVRQLLCATHSSSTWQAYMRELQSIQQPSQSGAHCACTSIKPRTAAGIIPAGGTSQVQVPQLSADKLLLRRLWWVCSWTRKCCADVDRALRRLVQRDTGGCWPCMQARVTLLACFAC